MAHASSQLHALQADLRILSAVRWPKDFEERFLSQTKKPAPHSIEYDYRNDPRVAEKRKHFADKMTQLKRIGERSAHRFGRDLPEVDHIFQNIIHDLLLVCKLIPKVGTGDFGVLSESLWGGPSTKLSPSSPSIVEVAEIFSSSLTRLSDEETERMFPKVLSAEGLATVLNQRLQDAHLIESIRIKISRKLTADAAAGKDYVKLKKDAKFSIKDADVLLFHEIFTHIVTGLNGHRQRHATWLGFDTPRCSSTQEGLAVFLEMLSGKTYPRRLRRIVDRILLLRRIEKGENCAQMYDWLREMRYGHKDSLALIMRAFRGCEPASRRPFTKDVSYLKGLIECFNFMPSQLAMNRYDRIHCLFCGKMAFAEVSSIATLVQLGVVEPARWIPREFIDLDWLVGWFTCVTALGRLSDPHLQAQFRT